MTVDPHAAMREHILTLSVRAWDGLRHSENLRPPLVDGRGLRLGRPRLQLWWDAAGFCDDEPHTLTVFEPFDRNAPPLLRKAVWKRSDDLRPLPDVFEPRTPNGIPEPRPTFDVCDASVDRSGFEALLGQARGLRIPVVWPWRADGDSLTTDVGTLGFEHFDLAQPQASVRCAWSVDLPPGWQAVADWFGRMSEWLERQLGHA